MQSSHTAEIRRIPLFDAIRSASQNEEIYFVGGCVRDILLGREVHDVDIVCFSTEYDKFALMLKEKLSCTAVPFKDNVRLIKQDVVIDVSKPIGGSIEEDLEKRDFTINNLACTADGKLIGDTSGINSREIRHVYENVFDDDPVRILRAFRFMSELCMDIADDTLRLIKEKYNLIESTASERIHEELKKLFQGADASRALKLTDECGILKVLFGSYSREGLVAARRVHEYSGKNPLILTTAALLYDHNGERCKILKKLNYPNKARKSVCTLLENYHRLEDFEKLSDIRAKRTAYDIYDIYENLLTLHKAVKGGGLAETEARLNQAASSLNMAKTSSVNGAFIMNLGFEPGEIIGKILSDVKKKIATGELESLTDAEVYIRNAYG